MKKDTNQTAPALLNRQQTAQALNMCVRTLDTITKDRKIPCFKLGGKVLYRLDRVLNALDALEQVESHRK